MKKIILALFCLFPLGGIAQSNYTISGKISGIKIPANAYLERVKNEAWKVVDSTEVKNGTFHFKGSLKEPEAVIIRIKRIGVTELNGYNDQFDFFLENSNIVINATDSIKNAIISGSETDRENKQLAALEKPFLNKIDTINKRFSSHNPNAANETQEARKLAGDSLNSYVASIRTINMRFVETHLNAFMGLYIFNYFILGPKFDPAGMEPLFHKFSPQLLSSEMGKSIAQKIETAKHGQVGIKVIDFTQNDINGEPFTLTSLRGKYVLIDFWASWCGPCRAENPNVRKAYQALKNKNFEIVSVSLDQSKGLWLEAINKDSMPWINVCDFKGWKNDAAVLYGVHSVPQNFLIDPKGVIVARDLRGEDLTEKLSVLIK